MQEDDLDLQEHTYRDPRTWGATLTRVISFTITGEPDQVYDTVDRLTETIGTLAGDQVAIDDYPPVIGGQGRSNGNVCRDASLVVIGGFIGMAGAALAVLLGL